MFPRVSQWLDAIGDEKNEIGNDSNASRNGKPTPVCAQVRAPGNTSTKEEKQNTCSNPPPAEQTTLLVEFKFSVSPLTL
jgi:hypothetical protein